MIDIIPIAKNRFDTSRKVGKHLKIFIKVYTLARRIGDGASNTILLTPHNKEKIYNTLVTIDTIAQQTTNTAYPRTSFQFSLQAIFANAINPINATGKTTSIEITIS